MSDQIVISLSLSLSLSKTTLHIYELYLGTDEFAHLRKAERKDIELFIDYLRRRLEQVQPEPEEAEALL